MDATELDALNPNDTIMSQRERLHFPKAVRQEFAFLKKYGFREIQALSTLVRFQRDEIEIRVYHGRSSYEIGLEFHYKNEEYSLGELIRISDPVALARFRYPQASTRNAVKLGVKTIGELTERYGHSALSGDMLIFARIRKCRPLWTKEFALDVLVAQVRPKAHRAFREGRYSEAVQLYGQISERLSEVERKKLAYAKSQSSL